MFEWFWHGFCLCHNGVMSHRHWPEQVTVGVTPKY